MIVLCIKPDKIGFSQIAPFNFLCPQSYQSRPKVRGEIDNSMISNVVSK